MELEERVVRAVNDKTEFESVLKEYRPFIASCARRATGKYIDEHDDEMSIAIIAFSEAVRRFEPRAGKFLNFANCVIRSRLIDERRANNKVKTLPLDLNIENGDKQNLIEMEDARDFCGDPLKLEIEELSSALKLYGADFGEIAKCSPKHKKTKKACAAAASCILKNPQLTEQLKRTRQMPINKIQMITDIPRKIIERHRNYIVCLVEILSGDYVYLAEYVKFVKEAESK